MIKGLEPPLIEKLIEIASSKDALAYFRREVRGSARQPRSAVSEAEQKIAARPEECFHFNAAGYATLDIGSSSWDAGLFEVPSLAWLRTRAADRASQGPLRLFVLHGTSELSDVAALQAFSDDATLFQVASQFNTLEAPGASIVRVADYFNDPTQGPRASISAFPGTLLRHYAAPRADGSRFIQTEGGEQIDLLRDVTRPDIADVKSGYLRARNVADPVAFAEILVRQHDAVRLGVHDGIEVLRGHEWDGPVSEPHPRIAQVFTSTLAGGGYSPGVDITVDTTKEPWRTIVRQLLRAAYLGTLLAAVSLGKRTVVLTLIGGGVFGNPHDLVREAIFWACDEGDTIGLPLDVVINIRENAIAPYAAAVLERGGTIVEV